MDGAIGLTLATMMRVSIRNKHITDMNDDISEAEAAWLVVLLALLLAFIGGCSIGRMYENNGWQTRAVNEGKAEWAKDEGGNTFFRWKR